MTTGTRVNPLHVEALTADDVQHGDRLLVWKPGEPTSTRHYTALGGWYPDDEDTMVIDVRDEDGTEHTFATSEIGLTGDRYSGVWTHIAIRDE
jgi:hypothetical protein